MKRTIIPLVPWALFPLVALYGRVQVTTTNPTASTSLGIIEGAVCPDYPAVAKYEGIPYSLPPVGDRRSRRPQPIVEKFVDGILKASAPGAQCPQAQTLESSVFPQSEDCLFLNVYTPVVKSKTLLPVTATDSILVTLNYRLGALGFLAHPALFDLQNTTGNYGTLHVQAALRWVQANIKAFGGDPTKVLLNGESAGATAAFLQLAIPSSAGLFSAVATESGVGLPKPTSSAKLGPLDSNARKPIPPLNSPASPPTAPPISWKRLPRFKESPNSPVLRRMQRISSPVLPAPSSRSRLWRQSRGACSTRSLPSAATT
ncbi:Alpha/Beta hydrolase protein [Blyttiomyces helicus]|uniref:Carboxylic ester hydrolase n=1 Tax=Blyttiomyces helicus TaxID=388810 RepID=A0A4P9WG45_9FUNG|nr:Alpha/Beta hydrolase protein [Blyttiomyces helicus]|eukprot:RKO91771.1 Alpha/Beta hydrolase protein [Blyttiomyces helicus]